MDAEYEPAEMETRTLFGLEMQQKRNDAVIDKSVFTNVVTKRQQVGSAFLLSELLVGWLCFTSHRQRSHLETAPPFTVPCKGREAQFLHRPHRELNPESLRGSPSHNRCATSAPPVNCCRSGVAVPLSELLHKNKQGFI